MPKPMMHLAQFLVHGPTYHSLAIWRHPRTAEAGYDWTQPELYQHIARVCERAKRSLGQLEDMLRCPEGATLVQLVKPCHNRRHPRFP